MVPVTTSIVTDPKSTQPNPITDLVLIYDGGTHRQPWTAQRITPYLFRENGGITEWLFDGFLFLEIFDEVKNIEYYPGYGKNSSAKVDWLYLLNSYFSDKSSFGALEAVLSDMARKGVIPQRKRKVVIGIPTPALGFTKWGELFGRSLDFNKTDDQVAAAQWFIDESLSRWKKKGYKNIELTGFYWIDEDADKYELAIKYTQKYAGSRGMKFYWIPYWNAKGADGWKELGFDYAYLQPNYFFNKTIPISRLYESIAYAQRYDLNLEIEFDNGISDPSFKARFNDYIKVFTEKKIWETLPVAYYEGGGAWYNMTISSDSALILMRKKIGDIIVSRQIKANESSTQ